MEENEFLFTEYEMCFEQLRFYDTRSSNLLKYLFTLTSAAGAVIYTIYEIFNSFNRSFYTFLTFFSIIIFIGSFLLYLSMIQNRLYFVFTCRQLNAIRKFLLKTNSAAFKDNQLFLSTTMSAIKAMSIHNIQFMGTSVVSGLYAGSFLFGLLNLLSQNRFALLWSSLFGISIAVLIDLGGYKYLKIKGAMTSDKAIHNQ